MMHLFFESFQLDHDILLRMYKQMRTLQIMDQYLYRAQRMVNTDYNIIVKSQVHIMHSIIYRLLHASFAQFSLSKLNNKNSNNKPIHYM